MISDIKQDCTTIHVFLLNEGVEVWRPVKARHIRENLYQILSNQIVDEDEEWQFQPGDIVVTEKKVFQSGDIHVTATKKVV